MKYFYMALASGLSASASVLRRQTECDCSFQVNVSGGPGSGPLGQYTDGQNRVGPDYGAASYCLNGDIIVDSSGRGCILTSPTTQFQCDSGATGTPGFTIACGGVISYNGNSTFWECAATGTGIYNIYTSPGGTDCHPVTLTTVNGACGAPCSSASASPTLSPAPDTTTATITISIPGPTTTSTAYITLPPTTVTPPPVTISIPGPTTTSTAYVTLPPTTVTPPPVTISIPGPTATSTAYITLPPTTITPPPVTISIPGPTITSTLPPTTITLPPTTVTLPPTTVTPPPVTISIPGPTTTSTAYITLPPTTITPPPVTISIPGPTITSTASITLPPTTVNLPPSTVTLPPTTVTLAPSTATVVSTITAACVPSTSTLITTVEGTTVTSVSTITAYMTMTVISTLVSTAPGGTMTITGSGETVTVTGPGETITVTGPGSTLTLPPTTSTSTQVITTTLTVSGSSTSSCPTDLSGEFQYPHLIIPVNSSSPDTAYGSQYFGTVTPTVSSIFNFDIPTSYAGHTCSLIFLLPNMSDLQTSSYTLTGTGGIVVTQLSGAATDTTTYDNQPSVNATLGTFDIAAGSNTLIVSGPCAAGETVAYELSATGSFALSYFQDYNPAPIGLYITEC